VSGSDPRFTTAALTAGFADMSLEALAAPEVGIASFLGELVEPKIGDHRGRFVKNTGDGFLLGSAPALLSTHGTGATRSHVPSPQRRAGCHALRRGKGLDQSAANSRPQNLHSRAVAIIGSQQYGQGARSSAVAVPGFMHAQTSAATHPNKVQPRSRLRTKMAPRLQWSRPKATSVGVK
jgi:hypothetical protein